MSISRKVEIQVTKFIRNFQSREQFMFFGLFPNLNYFNFRLSCASSVCNFALVRWHVPFLSCFLSHEVAVRQRNLHSANKGSKIINSKKQSQSASFHCLWSLRGCRKVKKQHSYSVLLGCLPWPQFHVKLYCSTTMRVAIKTASGSARLCVYIRLMLILGTHTVQ